MRKENYHGDKTLELLISIPGHLSQKFTRKNSFIYSTLRLKSCNYRLIVINIPDKFNQNEQCGMWEKSWSVGVMSSRLHVTSYTFSLSPRRLCRNVIARACPLADTSVNSGRRPEVGEVKHDRSNLIKSWKKRDCHAFFGRSQWPAGNCFKYLRFDI